MKTSVNLDTEFLCHCMRMTAEDVRGVLERKEGKDFADLYEKFGVGSQCASCEFEVRGLIDDFRAEAGIKAELTNARDPRRPQMRKKSLLERIARVWRKPEISMKGGLFALRQGSLVSKVVISNLNFPEDDFNPNGAAVRLIIRLVNAAGKEVAAYPEFAVAANCSREISLLEIYPSCPESFHGAFYLDFYGLEMTSGLRPYAILDNIDPASPVGARSHYHDKYATFQDPGFFQTAWPFYPGQTCWVAVSNCQNRPYESEAVLKSAQREIRHPFSLGPMESVWGRVSDFFPQGVGNERDFEPGLFYLENPQHVMVWFFWHHDVADSWIANHH